MNNRIQNIISFPIALWTMVVLNSLVIVFHFLILFQVIPFDVVWAGRLKSVEEMMVFESISIAVNGLLILVVLMKGDLIRTGVPVKVIDVVLWIFVAIFVLNTLGNLTSKTTLETLVATPLTLLLAILCWRLALPNKQNVVN